MVALIVRIWKVVQARGGRMVVVCSNPVVLEVIRLAGLDKVWTIAPEISAGHKKLGVRGTGGGAVSAPAGAPSYSAPLQRSSNPLLWIIALLLAAIVGLLIYLAVRQPAAAPKAKAESAKADETEKSTESAADTKSESAPDSEASESPKTAPTATPDGAPPGGFGARGGGGRRGPPQDNRP
jgi:hypothetical protein